MVAGACRTSKAIFRRFFRAFLFLSGSTAVEWLKPQSGNLVDSRPVATRAYPALADALGTYVHER